MSSSGGYRAGTAPGLDLSRVSRRTLLRAGLGAGAALALADGWSGGPHGALARPTDRPARRQSASPESIVADRVQAFMARQQTPGIAVALVNGGADHLYSFGYADPDTRVPVTEDVLFNLGSITKVLTAILLAHQVVDPNSRAPKRLTDPVTRYLPVEVAGSGLAHVSLVDLATHTAGLPREARGVAQPGTTLYADEPPPRDLVDWWRAWTPPAASPPGARFLYSNVGFVTLGFAVVSQPGAPHQQTYNQLLADLVTGPLGMFATGAPIAPGRIVARGYLKRGDTLQPVRTRAANPSSTTRDLVPFMTACLGALDRPVPPVLTEALALAQQPHWRDPSGQLGFDMGLGWQIHDRRTDVPPILAKNGATTTSGHSCVVLLMPARQVGLALLTNAFGPGMGPTGLGMGILRALAAA